VDKVADIAEKRVVPGKFELVGVAQPSTFDGSRGDLKGWKFFRTKDVSKAFDDGFIPRFLDVFVNQEMVENGSLIQTVIDGSFVYCGA
jgi:hypothetical protein